MNLTPKELNKLCHRCCDLNIAANCWAKNNSSLWETCCPCSECILKTICNNTCDLFHQWFTLLYDRKIGRNNPSVAK